LSHAQMALVLCILNEGRQNQADPILAVDFVGRVIQ
jgi:hypothetical protein